MIQILRRFLLSLPTIGSVFCVSLFGPPTPTVLAGTQHCPRTAETWFVTDPASIAFLRTILQHHGGGAHFDWAEPFSSNMNGICVATDGSGTLVGLTFKYVREDSPDRLYGHLKVKDLPVLNWLDIHDAGFSAITLSNLPALQSIAMFGVEQVTSLSLDNLSSLDELSITFTENLSQLRLHDLPRLTSFRLSWSKSTELDISDLPALTDLEINHGVLVNVNGLRDLPSLKRLSLGNHAIRDISGLAALPSLEHLHLSRNRVSDLSPLSGLTRLKSLKLYDNPIADVRPLASLSVLQELVLSGGSERVDLTGLEGLRRLERLELTLASAQTNLAPVAALGRLKELVLLGGPFDLRPLESLSHLTRFRADHANASTVSSVGRMTGLRSVSLDVVGDVDVAGLKNLGDLRHLSLTTETASVGDLSALRELRRLQILSLEGVKGAHLIDELAGFCSLEGLAIQSAGLTRLDGLDALKNLRGVTFTDNRLHDVSVFRRKKNMAYIGMDKNRLSVSQLAALPDRGPGEQFDVYFHARVLHMGRGNSFVVPESDRRVGTSRTHVTPLDSTGYRTDQAVYDETTGEVTFSKPGVYQLSMGNDELFGVATCGVELRITTGKIYVVDALPTPETLSRPGLAEAAADLGRDWLLAQAAVLHEKGYVELSDPPIKR